MRNLSINLLAGIGALWLLSAAGRTARDFVVDTRVRLILHDERGSPIRGAIVFVDRSDGAVERIVIDTTGIKRLGFTSQGGRNARWLVCAPGFAPAVGMITSDANEEDMMVQRAREGQKLYVRRRGWLGPIPRECPQVNDPVIWLSRGADLKTRIEYSEPDWNDRP